jgi:hypothetical protein
MTLYNVNVEANITCGFTVLTDYLLVGPAHGHVTSERTTLGGTANTTFQMVCPL